MKPTCTCSASLYGYNDCAIHSYRRASNAAAYALGEKRRGGFHVRRIVWGKLMARSERRPGETIRPAIIEVRNGDVR